MTKTLKVLADLVDARAYQTVLSTKEQISPGLDRLVLSCPEFADASTDPCDATAFRISRNDFRHYTPALLDTDRCEVTIVVQRHGSGPGEDLIASWSGGESVRLSRWASTRNFRWPETPEPVVLVGDGTVISLAMSMRKRAEVEGRAQLTVLEAAAGDVPAVRELLPQAHVVPSEGAPGVALDAWLGANPDLIDADARFYLAGHGQSIQRQRTALREKHTIDKRQIRTQPYWATGKVGL